MRSTAAIVSVGGRRSEPEKATYRLLEVGDEVVAVLVLLQAGERHLGTRNVLYDASQGQPPTAKRTRSDAPSWGSRGTRKESARSR